MEFDFNADEFDQELEVYFDLLEQKGQPFPIHLLEIKSDKEIN